MVRNDMKAFDIMQGLYDRIFLGGACFGEWLQIANILGQ